MKFIGIFLQPGILNAFWGKPYTPYFCIQKDHDLIKIVIKFSCKAKKKPRDRKKMFLCVFMKIFSLL